MTEEQKDLLLKDLSARLPHRIKASYYGVEEECETWDEIEGITPDGYVDIGQYSLPIECIKPYLFPLSSMTDDQEEELKYICYSFNGMFQYTERILDKIPFRKMKYFPYQIEEFFNKNHIDYRGLIEKGLAIDATGLNIY